jgi:hypothetical protein
MASLVEDLQVDAAAELLDEVREKEKVSVSTKANGQDLTRRAFMPDAVGLTISWPDLSLPDNRLLGVSYLEIGLGTETFAGEGDQNEQAPAVGRNRPFPLSIAPEAMKFTAGQRVLKDPGLEGFTGRGPLRVDCRVCIRCDLFTSASGNGEPQEEE